MIAVVRRILIPLAGCLAALVSCGPAGPGGPPARPAGSTDEWSTLAPALSRRTEVTAAATRDKIYVSGGFVEGGATVPTVEVYDAQNDAFRKGPDLPVAVNHAMSTSLITEGTGGVVYVMGGYLSGLSRPTDRAFSLDESENPPGWKELPRMPEARAAAGAAAVDGKIYVAGGIGAEGLAGSSLVFDPAAGRWDKVAGLPTPREHLGVAGLAGRLYAVGGRAPQNLAAAEAFDPRQGSWSKLPDMPTARGGLASAAVSGLVVAPGGEQPSGTYAEVEAFDVERRDWVSLPRLPTPRHGLGVAAIGDRLYVIAGGPEPGFAFSNANEALRVQR